MTDNTSIWQHPAVFFLTRSLILIGMMIWFGILAYSIAIYTGGVFFGFDFMENPSQLNNFSNPALIPALKYIQLIVSLGVFVVPAWLFSKSMQQRPVDFLQLNTTTTIKEIAIAIVLVFAAMPFISWLVYMNSFISLPQWLADMEAQLMQAEKLATQITTAFLKADDAQTLWFNILVIAIAPAIGEELLFRGVLQNFFRQLMPNKHVVVWLVAIIFSAFHGQFYGFIPRLFLGAMLGYVYLFSGNLWLCILMHFANNAFAVVCNYAPLQQQLPAYMQNEYVFESWYINTGSAVACGMLIIILYKLTYKRMEANGE